VVGLRSTTNLTSLPQRRVSTVRVSFRAVETLRCGPEAPVECFRGPGAWLGSCNCPLRVATDRRRSFDPPLLSFAGQSTPASTTHRSSITSSCFFSGTLPLGGRREVGSRSGGIEPRPDQDRAEYPTAGRGLVPPRRRVPGGSAKWRRGESNARPLNDSRGFGQVREWMASESIRNQPFRVGLRALRRGRGGRGARRCRRRWRGYGCRRRR
jgi:hypothetical protein